ncbi:MAG: hypothetical protein LBJ68_01555 [Endomicrobium sp.]|nr:hypothetical protein [Endomicrobium sp.]
MKKIDNCLALKNFNNLQRNHFEQRESVKRILDANLNRCREGLRVIEDSLRFVLNDEIFYKKIRSIRHDIDKIFRNRYAEFMQKRNSHDDFGKWLMETSKKKMSDVIVSNFKRIQESLRVLEEYSKIFEPTVSICFKRERYAIYVMEKLVYLRYKNFLNI